MNETILIVVSMCVNLVACTGNSNTRKQNDERTDIYIVNHADDAGKHGEGTYINMNTEYKDRDGIRWSKDNIFAPRTNESLDDPNYTKRTEVFQKEINPYEKGYEEGYEEGYKDAYHSR